MRQFVVEAADGHGRLADEISAVFKDPENFPNRDDMEFSCSENLGRNPIGREGGSLTRGRLRQLKENISYSIAIRSTQKPINMQKENTFRRYILGI